MPRVILFLCVANSARSQMAEGLARAMRVDGLEVFSAGSKPAILNPLATAVLAERDIATTGQYAKGVEEVPLSRVDTVITLCEEEVCPRLSDTIRHEHWPMPDPAATEGNEAERLASFRSVRDMIDERLRSWPPFLDQQSATA